MARMGNEDLTVSSGEVSRFPNLLKLLNTIELELGRSHAKPELTPLPMLNDLLTPAEAALVANAYEQPGWLTLLGLRAIIYRVEAQIAVCPHSDAPVRLLLRRMDVTAANVLS